jgi:two-component system sensor kinase FixL
MPDDPKTWDGKTMPELSAAEQNIQADANAKQRALDESELLLSLYRALIENLDLTTGLRVALEILCQFTGWVVGTAWLPAEDKAQIGLCSFWHREDPKLDEFISFCQQQIYRRDSGIPGRVWHREKEEWTRDLAAEPAEFFPLAPVVTTAGLKAAFAVPIIHDGHVDGVLMFHSRETKQEDERLIRVISRTATQLGFALHHKRTEKDLLRQDAIVRQTHEELERQVQQRTSELRSANQMLHAEIAQREELQVGLHERMRQQAAVAEVGQHALRGADLPALMEEVAVLVAQTLSVEFSKILELLPGQDALLLRSGVGWKEGLVGHATVSAGMNSQAGYTLLCKEPVIVKDLRTEERFNGPPLLRDHGVVSGMSVIIGRSNQPFGILGAHTARPRNFSKDDIYFLQAVANVLSQVIDNNRAVQELRRNATWLDRLIDTTQDAVLSIDRQGRIVLFNPAAERIFGYPRNEVIGQKVNQLMAEPYATEHDEYIARYEKTGEARAIGRIRTVTARRKNGESFPIELSVTEIAVDREVHYAAFIRDISEKTRLQTQLVESERLAAIGGTAAKIGHELANPLNGMSLTVQLLEQRLSRMADGSGDPLASTTKRLKDEISRLQKLASEFATISRKEKYAFRPVDLTQLVDDIVGLQAQHLAQHGIEIHSVLARDLPILSVDGDKIKQALLNLVKNAGEAMPDGGKITIEAFAKGDAVILEITDTGNGIPLDVDAFEPFMTTKKEGTGVGLVIVRQILTAHAGKISYRSRPGEGTTFRIELPQN